MVVASESVRLLCDDDCHGKFLPVTACVHTTHRYCGIHRPKLAACFVYVRGDTQIGEFAGNMRYKWGYSAAARRCLIRRIVRGERRGCAEWCHVTRSECHVRHARGRSWGNSVDAAWLCCVRHALRRCTRGGGGAASSLVKVDASRCCGCS